MVLGQMGKYPHIKWLWLSLGIIIADLATKALISDSFQLYQSKPIIDGFFNLTLAHNYGAAFSFLADQSGWQRWFLSGLSGVVSLILLIWITRLKPEEKILAIGLSLVLGGAIGNLWDRITLGYVVDFLDVYYGNWHWPAFNIADSAICVGAGFLLFDAFFLQNREAEPSS